MNISKTRKTMRVLYLYLTIPLLLVTMLLFAIALMSATTKKKSSSVPEISVKSDEPERAKPSDVTAKPNRPSVEITPPAKEEKPTDTTAGQTAIITAIMTGITGLLGAIVQVIIAFMKAQEKRKNEREA
jgi:ABC-type glycerol-3-phosphate transport system permease component